MKIIIDFNRTIYDPDKDELFPGVLELLRKLSEDNELFLVSKAESNSQKKAEESGVTEYFKGSYFTGSKSKEIFEEIAGGDSKVLVVGDRISKEIKIGNQLGFVTVRLKVGKFADEDPEDVDEVAAYEINNILELESLVLNANN